MLAFFILFSALQISDHLDLKSMESNPISSIKDSSAMPNTLYLKVTEFSTNLPFLAIFHRDTLIEQCSSVCTDINSKSLAGVYFQEAEPDENNSILLSRGYMTIITGEENTTINKQSHLLSTRRYTKFIFGQDSYAVDILKKNRTININCDINYMYCDYKVRSYNYNQEELNRLVYTWPYHRIYTTDLNGIIPSNGYLEIEIFQQHFDYDLRPLSFYFDGSTESQNIYVEGVWVSYNWDINKIWVIIFSLLFGAVMIFLIFIPNKVKKLLKSLVPDFPSPK